MGRAPREIGPGDAPRVTRVAAHPQRHIVAAGFEDGAVRLADIASGDHVLIRPPGDGAVSALLWTADGRRLAFATEQGALAVAAVSGSSAP